MNKLDMLFNVLIEEVMKEMAAEDECHSEECSCKEESFFDFVKEEIVAMEKEYNEIMRELHILGNDRVKKPRSYPEFRPHASIVTIEKKDIKFIFGI